MNPDLLPPQPRSCHLCGQPWVPPQALQTINGEMYWAGRPFGTETPCINTFRYLLDHLGERLSVERLLHDLEFEKKHELIYAITLVRRTLKALDMPFVVESWRSRGYMMRQKA